MYHTRLYVTFDLSNWPGEGLQVVEHSQASAGLRGVRLRFSESTWLFGSVARDESTAESDIDLLIVADDLQASELHDRHARLHSDVRTWTGNDLQLIEHSQVSWRKLVRARNPLVEQIRNDGIAFTTEASSLLGLRT